LWQYKRDFLHFCVYQKEMRKEENEDDAKKITGHILKAFN
jgi:hypothetical protein